MGQPTIYSAEGSGYKTLVGQDGWLFIWDINHLTEQAQGRILWSDADERLAEETLRKRISVCEGVGARYLHVVVPDKSSVYPDKLPAGIVRAKRTILEQHLDLLQRLDGLVPSVDLIDLISKRREEGQKVYHQTDSHWTYPMAMEACDEIIRATGLGARLPAVDPASLSWRERKKVFELAALTPEPYSEEFAMPTVSNPQSQLVYENQARGRGRTQVYEGGRGEARVLLFRDSFSSMFLLPLAESCRRLVAVNSVRVFHELVVAEKPDIVVFQVSERFLYPSVSDDTHGRLESVISVSDIVSSDSGRIDSDDKDKRHG